MRIKSNTNLLPLLDFGTYGGTCDPEHVLFTDSIDEDYKDGYSDFTQEEFWSNFDKSAYMEHLQKLAANYIERTLLPEIKALNIGILDIIVTGQYSPKYYNFETDTLDFSIVVEDDFKHRVLALIDMVAQDALEDYLRSEFSSYDGFWSHVSNNISDLKDRITEDVDCRETNVFLWWYFKNNIKFFNRDSSDWDNYAESWTEYLIENSYYSEFIDADFVPKSREIDKCVASCLKDKYMDETFDEMLAGLLVIGEEEEYDLHKVEERFKEEYHKILNHSYKLDLWKK